MIRTQNTRFYNSNGNVIRRLVNETDRPRALPKFFGDYFVSFEANVYQKMRFLTDDYNGGLWIFYTLSNGGFYMAPNTHDTFFMVNPINDSDASLSADAAGITVCCFTFSNLSFEYPDSCMAERFHQLRDFALEQDEAASITRLLD